jgi:hypothetical protein
MLLSLVAFSLLSAVRFYSLKLVTPTIEDKEGSRMGNFKKLALSVILETGWAIGVSSLSSVLGGNPSKD